MAVPGGNERYTFSSSMSQSSAPQLWRILPNTYNSAGGRLSLKKSPGKNFTRDNWDSGIPRGIK